jgi:desulfoferrodoxin-like iron-binding protein
MTTKIYQCLDCGYLVEVAGQWGGGLTCCGGPKNFCRQGRLKKVPEKQSPPLDLTESMANGKPRWQFV